MFVIQESAERKLAIMQSVLLELLLFLAPVPNVTSTFSCAPKISPPAPDPGTVFLGLHRSPARFQAYPGTGFGFWERSLAGTLQ